jgi:hypothetical protein
MTAATPLVESDEMVAASGAGGGQDARGSEGGALTGQLEHKRGRGEERKVRVATHPF